MIVLITGMMAAGKTTVAQGVAERLEKSVHLRGDAFRRMIVNGRVDMSADAADAAYDQLMLRYRLARSAALAYADAGFDVIYQDTIIGPALAEVVERFGNALAAVVVLNPSADVIRQREASRGKQGYTSFSVEDLHDVFQTTPNIGYWLDSSDQTAGETVDHVLDLIT